MPLSPQAQAIVDDFGRQPGVSPEHVVNLQGVLAASPVLLDQFNEAVAKQRVLGLKPLTDPNAGGTFTPDDHSIRLPLARLSNGPGGKSLDSGEMTFVLGHELQHGLYSPAVAASRKDFETAAVQIAKTTHDYSDSAEKVLSSNRMDEASAEIAGWNATVSRVRQSNPHASLEDIYREAPGRMHDFIDRTGGMPQFNYALKSNLTLNADMTMPANAANVEAMGVNFFDKAAKSTRIGHAGQSDYANHYGPWVIGTAAIYERHYNKPRPGDPEQPMILDMQRLGLKEHVLLNNPTDKLAAGEKVFLVQGTQSDPAHHRADMATVQAVQTPENQSFERVQSINQAQSQAREQQQALEQSQQEVPPPGPTMTR